MKKRILGLSTLTVAFIGALTITSSVFCMKTREVTESTEATTEVKTEVKTETNTINGSRQYSVDFMLSLKATIKEDKNTKNIQNIIFEKCPEISVKKESEKQELPKIKILKRPKITKEAIVKAALYAIRENSQILFEIKHKNLIAKDLGNPKTSDYFRNYSG